MPTVTQSRVFPHGRYYYHTYGGTGAGNPSLLTQTYAPLLDGSQTTTSWRTGRLADSLVDQSDATQGSSISAGVFGRLKSEQSSGAFQTSFDNGHTFSSVKTEVVACTMATIRGRQGTQYQDYTYWGPLVPRTAIMPWTPRGFPPVSTQVSSTTWYEQQAIERTIPTSPVANLAQGLAELVREGIPSAVGAALLGMRDNIAKTLGGEYLNLKFGWEPIIGDLKSLAQVVLDSDELLKQAERGSGRNTRRRYTFPPIVDVVKQEAAGSTLHYASGFGPVLAAAINAAGTNTIQIDRRETNVWFSGAYTYHFQEVSKGQLGRHRNAVQKAQYLLGLDLTPEVVWELAPWSWLTDWFVNIGSNMSQISRFAEDGLVLRYGYLMVQSTVERTYVTEGVRTFRDPTRPFNVSLVLRTTSKERRRATPYGFALNPSSFTGRQWAILAALGMTKTPNSLRT